MLTNQFSYSLKKYLIPKLTKHKNFQMITHSLYSSYCKLVGPLHVLPDFYIIGGQKCGTTSLFMYLESNPQINSAAVKDIRFFDKYFFKGANWYRVYFPLKSQKLIQEKNLQEKILTIDATERYFDHPLAPNRIKKLTPNAKFIVLLRNPVDRSFSHYSMIKNRSDELFREKLPFEEAIEKEPERIADKFVRMKNDSNYYDDTYFRYGYLSRGLYFQKLQRWMEVFPKEQFLILQSEEFFKDTASVYKQVLEFLGLSEWKPKNFFHYKKNQSKEYQMDPKTREKLIEYFKPHNQKLYDFLGRKFDWDK